MDGDWHACANWNRYSQHVGQVHPSLAKAIPDFLIISPPKTGTSWLYEVLLRHPDIYLPQGKEMRYFDVNWRRHDINEYLRRFADGVGLLRGEISPPYCLLPNVAIAAIKRLNPAMKLIFLARDPVAQAWSLMKHNFSCGEDNFRNCEQPFEALTFSDYLENFAGDYALSSTDHLGMLQRWRAHFPAEQFWIGTLEEIAADPVATVNSILGFLGANPSRLSADAPVHEVVFAGLSAQIDRPSEVALRTLHRRRARRFVESLRGGGGKDLRSSWGKTLDGEILSYPLTIQGSRHTRHLLDGVFYEALNEGSVSAAPAASLLSAEFGYELDWLARVARTGDNSGMSLSRFPEGCARLVADQRLKAVLDNEFHAGRVAHDWDAPPRENRKPTPLFSSQPPVGLRLVS